MTMTDTSPSVAAAAAPKTSLVALLGVTGVLFVLYPVVRPWSDETGLAGAEAFASTAWVASHTFAMVGFIVLGLVVLQLRDLLAATAGGGAARAATLLTWMGAGLTLPYYGAETFALNAVGQRAVRDDDVALLELVDPTRFGPVQATMFGIGLLLLGAGVVAVAVGVRRSGHLPRWSGYPVAAGFLLFIPQFYAPPALRIAHGVLIGVGCMVLAAALWRQRGIAGTTRSGEPSLSGTMSG